MIGVSTVKGIKEEVAINKTGANKFESKGRRIESRNESRNE